MPRAGGGGAELARLAREGASSTTEAWDPGTTVPSSQLRDPVVTGASGGSARLALDGCPQKKSEEEAFLGLALAEGAMHRVYLGAVPSQDRTHEFPRICPSYYYLFCRQLNSHI